MKHKWNADFIKIYTYKSIFVPEFQNSFSKVVLLELSSFNYFQSIYHFNKVGKLHSYIIFLLDVFLNRKHH